MAHLVLPGPRIVDGPYRWLGVALFAGGVVLMLWAVRALDAAGTTHDTKGTPRALVTTGPMALSRNPMYVGVTGVLIGIAMVVGTAAMWLAPVAFWVTMDRIYVPYEESPLEGQLGVSYREYTSRVRRWM